MATPSTAPPTTPPTTPAADSGVGPDPASSTPPASPGNGSEVSGGTPSTQTNTAAGTDEPSELVGGCSVAAPTRAAPSAGLLPLLLLLLAVARRRSV